MELKKILMFVLVTLFSYSCTEPKVSDAYGQFEADEVSVSAEMAAKILFLKIKEGDRLLKGVQVGQLDTIQLSLQKKELAANVRSIRSKIDQLNAQTDVVKEKLHSAEIEMKRLTSLREQNAATQQQVDQAVGQVNVLRQQIHSINIQKQSVYAELNVMETKKAQLIELVRKSSIINPINGVVLSKFKQAHEFIHLGQPIYTIAALDEMILRTYISGARLSNIKLGQEVDVFIDKNAEELETLKGNITWISSRAEFTPKMIQTREERITQVYAVKILVSNPEGQIKIGMPGEVRFNSKN